RSPGAALSTGGPPARSGDRCGWAEEQPRRGSAVPGRRHAVRGFHSTPLMAPGGGLQTPLRLLRERRKPGRFGPFTIGPGNVALQQELFGPSQLPTPPPGGPLRIGTSGYSFKDWIGPVYPLGTTPGGMLSHYATRFNALEVNTSYYAIPRPSVLLRMAERT